MSTSTKTCNACGETKLIEAFSIDNERKDGRRNQCKACRYKGVRVNQVEIEPVESFDPDLEFKRRWQNWIKTYGYDAAVAKARAI